MADKIRFYFDEHLPRAVAQGLRQRGIDVVRAQDIGLRQADDMEHLHFARRENRVIVTEDSDFLRLDGQGLAHPGIVYFEQDRSSIGQMIAALALISEAMTPDEMENHVEHW